MQLSKRLKLLLVVGTLLLIVLFSTIPITIETGEKSPFTLGMAIRSERDNPQPEEWCKRAEISPQHEFIGRPFVIREKMNDEKCSIEGKVSYVSWYPFGIAANIALAAVIGIGSGALVHTWKKYI